MRFFFILFCLLAFIGVAQAQDIAMFEKKSYTSSTGFELPYRILYPEKYDKSKKYPVILFLHGSGERGNDNEKQLVHGSKLFLQEENRKNYPAIIIFPQCPAENYWSSVSVDRSKSPLTLSFDYTKPATAPLIAAVELVKKVIKEEGGDASRVYITGLSMGGMGTFEAVYRNPDLFIAATPICGGGDDVHYDDRVKKVAFRLYHGDVDAVVDVKESRKMKDKLVAVGITPVYKEYPGVNHNSWDNAFAEPDFISWFFKFKKK